MDSTKSFSISKQAVWEAYQRVKANHGAAGIDGESITEFAEQLKDNLFKLWNRLASGSYFPPPVKVVAIAKKEGGQRLLGVPTVADRIAQTVVKQALEPLVEPQFHRDSYGYRPGKSAHQALETTRQRCWRYAWVVKFDIKGAFDNLSHTLMMKALRHHTDCKWILVVQRTLAHRSSATSRWAARGADERHRARRGRESVTDESCFALCV
jgi:RNA-directed DNA polymerase